MTEQQSNIVQSSYAKFLARAINNANVLYENLFEIAPQTKEVFQNTTNEKKSQMFVAIIRKIVKGIHDWENVKKELEELAQQHKNYKLQPEYFQHLEMSLITTLKNIAEDEWNSSLEDAWSAYFKKVANVIKEKVFE